MNNALCRLIGLLLLAGPLALGAGTAQAHPHVWITASSQLIYAPDGSITGLRQATSGASNRPRRRNSASGSGSRPRKAI